MTSLQTTTWRPPNAPLTALRGRIGESLKGKTSNHSTVPAGDGQDSSNLKSKCSDHRAASAGCGQGSLSLKRLLVSSLVILSLLLIFTSTALASIDPAFSVDATPLAPRGGNYIVDETGTLTEAQINSLNGKAAALLEKRKCAVYVWIVDLVPADYDRTIDTLERYVDLFYEKYDLGYGDKKNGMVLLIETGDVQGHRDYLLNTHGACTSVFSNAVRERVLDNNVVPLFRAAFSNGNFYRVADEYYNQVESEFSANAARTLGLKLGAIILIPILVALIVCSIWKRQMKTAVIARTADNYIPRNGFVLTGQTDLFLYRTTTRTKIERSSSSSGGSRSSGSGRSSGGRV